MIFLYLSIILGVIAIILLFMNYIINMRYKILKEDIHNLYLQKSVELSNPDLFPIKNEVDLEKKEIEVHFLHELKKVVK